jgi:rod shape determining protein RodA
MYLPRLYIQLFHLDKPLLLGLFTLSCFGLVTLYSAAGQDLDMVLRQAMRIGMGFGILILLAQIRLQQIIRWIPWLYVGGVSLLVIVLIIGDISKGSQRWLDLGVVRFQPSEMMKIIVPLMVTWYLSDRPLPPNLSRVIISMALTIVPVLLIAKQPDLGTALLIGSSGMFVLFLAGLSWRIIFSFIAAAPVAIWALWHVLHDYQRQRVLTLLDPENDPLGTGYHIIQSIIAIGSGGVYGKGWLNGTQSHLEFLPERTTDFIFAVYSEEFGLIGIILLLMVYLFVIVRGIIVASRAQGTFSRLFSGGLIFTFFVYIFVNMGMVMGVLPVVGLPLPLISYGGTSVVTLMAGFGLFMAVNAQRHLLYD